MGLYAAGMAPGEFRNACLAFAGVYVREEHLLDGLRSLPPELTGGGDQDVADYLRARW